MQKATGRQKLPLHWSLETRERGEERRGEERRDHHQPPLLPSFLSFVTLMLSFSLFKGRSSGRSSKNIAILASVPLPQPPKSHLFVPQPMSSSKMMPFSSMGVVPIILCLAMSMFFLPISAQSCTTLTFSQNRAYSRCNSLPRLSSSLHWTYDPASATADIAYRAPQTSHGWVAWALNPSGQGMVGAQALVALRSSTTGVMTAYTTPITNKAPSMQQGSLSFAVSNLAAEFSGNVITIFARISLPSNRTRLNHVWQASTSVANGLPAGHLTSGDNVQSLGTIDFLSGQASSGGGNSRLRRRNTHGVLNAVSWGILMPIGAIMARYLRVFKSADPAWFYLHVTCQCSAYILGVAGWGTGLKLGSESLGITYSGHRNIGIILFCLATLQVFALLLRPQKDHKYRFYWNVYHHSVGYTVIILSIVNIFKGFDILVPDKKWKHRYIGVISTLAVIAVILEVSTWIIVMKSKARSSEKSHRGVDAGHGYGGRQTQVV